MKKFLPLALVATLVSFTVLPVAVNAEDAAAPAGAIAGKSIYAANGSRIATIYRVTETGLVQVILEGRLVTVPNSSLSEVDGKLVTKLTKVELRKAR
ncbi:hypothetical protein [Novosphingobium sp. TH158]|uniref:hypothetical protein n=1 Tax=Novosphingobium sp. TH158 TaxID=2067455 RepID=UPI000C7A60FA|nr:hypothetical protein [Novosphingobium sp. TH158]PLK26165.1 hypothetical protein C0V78_04150 [Novosphingobium sp. TH158]